MSTATGHVIKNSRILVDDDHAEAAADLAYSIITPNSEDDDVYSMGNPRTRYEPQRA
jgi:hypothetical protein